MLKQNEEKGTNSMGNEKTQNEKQDNIIDEKDSLLSQMHHDIRTPLNGITGIVYLMRQNIGNPQKTEEYLEKLEDVTYELKRQVEAVFQLANMVGEGVNPVKEIIDLNEIAASGHMTDQSGVLEDRQANVLEVKEEHILSGKNVLIAEDNEINLVITFEILESWGCTIATARDGAQAVKAFRDSSEGTFDYILMDIRMPFMDGYEAARKIRALKRSDAQKVVIIALTANAYETESEKVRLSGMNGIITKPLHVSALKHLMCMMSGTQK